MSLDLRKRLFDELNHLVLVDPHTHINPLDPASHSLGDILGYHYYTELAHSAGMPKDRIEEPGLDSRTKVRRLVENLGPLDNTIQYSWLVEMARTLFGLVADAVTPDNWQRLFDAAAVQMAQPDWPQQVLAKSKLEAVFLTNEFDDPLEGFDTTVYIPCLRTDDLVFQLARPEVRERLEKASGIAPSDAQALKRAIGALFVHFKTHGARACAISLPPDFAPHKVSPARANTALAAINADGIYAAASHKNAIANFVFWTLAEMCAEYKLPFDLMIGVNRGVYEAGVHQGRDLFDSRVSLVQYKELFNAFPQVTFPISVLASVTNQELVSFAWIFPNVVTNGHWWYSNTPAFIEHDLAARLEAVPRSKQIAYYSDMYKLEFALPKFNMFKRILAKVLAEQFVVDRGWTEERAVTLGTEVLRTNTERIFRWGEDLRGELPAAGVEKKYFINPEAPMVASTGPLLTPRDEVRIEPPVDAWEPEEPATASPADPHASDLRMTMQLPTKAEIDAAAEEALLEESPPEVKPAEESPLQETSADGRMTMQMPSREEIAAAAEDELQLEDMSAVGRMTMGMPSQAQITAAAAELEAEELELEADDLELVDEPAKPGEDSGTLSLEEEGSAEAQDTYSIRHTELLGHYGKEQPQPEKEVPPQSKGDWGFLDEGKK